MEITSSPLPRPMIGTQTPPTAIEFPESLQCLFQPKRFKILWGGRGAGRSWGVARALLLKGLQQPLRVLCVREFQNSIGESVHKVLSDQIEALSLSEYYRIEKAKIYGPNGTEFSFEGIKNNTTRIKSYEGIDICWVEEAVKVSKSSWEILIPTIRRENSEIWMTFNPELETDYTYRRFVLQADDSCIVRKMTFEDNPWFPEVLRQEMLRDKERDYDSYLNVWLGHCKVALQGAVYGRELRRAMEENRICKVPYEQSVPVDVFFDLGRADNTAMWFAQRVGMERRLLKYHEANGTSIPIDDLTGGINYFIRYMQGTGYIIGTVFLPHDAKAKRLGSKRSIEEIFRQGGFRVQIVPRLSVTDGINAARIIFPTCWFDEEGCEDGINALRHYRYKVMESIDDNSPKQLSNDPVHDWASDGADAFRYFAVGSKMPRQSADGVLNRLARAADALRGKDVEFSRRGGNNNLGWMG